MSVPVDLRLVSGGWGGAEHTSTNPLGCGLATPPAKTSIVEENKLFALHLFYFKIARNSDVIGNFLDDNHLMSWPTKLVNVVVAFVDVARSLFQQIYFQSILFLSILTTCPPRLSRSRFFVKCPQRRAHMPTKDLILNYYVIADLLND